MKETGKYLTHFRTILSKMTLLSLLHQEISFSYLENSLNIKQSIPQQPYINEDSQCKTFKNSPYTF